MKKKNLLLLATIYGIALFVFLFLFLILFFFFWNNEQKNKMQDIAKQKEYDITFENYFDFYITENDVKYYYRNILGRTKLLKIYTEPSCKTDYNVVDGIGKITQNFISREELCELYKRSMEIEKEFH